MFLYKPRTIIIKKTFREKVYKKFYTLNSRQLIYRIKHELYD